MKWLIYPLIVLFALSGSAFAQGKGKGQGKAKGPKHQQEETTSEESGGILEDILGNDDDEDDEDDGKGQAKNKNKNKGREDDDDEGDIAGSLPDIIFGEDEKEKIGEYYSKNRVNVDTLPPGIAKNYARGKPLPPGIAKKNLPTDLESQLPTREGFERIIIGEDVALVDEKTQQVVDIIKGVLGR